MATRQLTKIKAKGRKIGRSERKRKGATQPLALYVRNRISAEEYFRLTKQTTKR